MDSENKKPEVWTWLDHPQNIKRLKIGFYIVLALLVVPDFFMHKHSLFSPVEAWPGFYAFFWVCFLCRDYPCIKTAGLCTET